MKKIIITSAVTLALSLGACSEQKTAEQLLASANQYSQEGKYGNAVVDYKNAVRLSPKNADARLGLGNAYLNQGNYISAEKEIEKAAQLGTSFSQTAPLLAQVKTRLDKFDEVEKLVKASEDLADTEYLIVLTYAGISALADGKAIKAQDYLSQAAAINANAPFSKLAKAYLLNTERNSEEALAVVNALLAADNKFGEAIRLQGSLYFSINNYELASKAFSSYISQHPQDYNIQFFQANALIKAEKFDEANVLTDKLLKYFKKSPLALQYKSQIEYQATNYMQARDYANQAIAYDESFVVAKMVAGISSFKLDELEQAYDHLIGLESLLPVTHPVNVILLSIKIKLGHTDDLASSVARLNAIKDSDSNTDVLQITSLELMKIGDYTNAQLLLNKAGKFSPNNARIKVNQGALLLSQGDLSGIKSIEEAINIDPSLHETEFALARQYIQGNEINKAQAIANKWLTSEKYKAAGNVLLGLIASNQKKVVDAEAYFKKALSLDENNISALYSLASVHDFKKQIEEALSGYERVIKLSPNHYSAIERYGGLQAKKNNAAVAISFLSALHDQNKLNGNIHKNLVIGLALNLREIEQNSAAIELLETIKDEKNLSSRYWIILANSHEVNQQNDNALVTYEQGIKVNPNTYILRVGYINLLEKLTKYAKALVISKQANKDFPNDNNLMTKLAYLELANNNVKAAKKQLSLLKLKGTSNALIIATEAEIAMREKNYEQAITLYSGIYEKDNNALNAIKLARALQFSLQKDKAEKLLENYVLENNDDTKVSMLLAELYTLNNKDGKKSAQVINTYKRIIKIQPKNEIALNNLSWQQYQTNDLDNALEHIEKALKLDPNNISFQETYGVILVAKSKFDKGISVLGKVQEQGSNDINAKLSLAQAYIATKQLDKAKVLLVGLSAHDSKLNSKIIKLKQSIENK